MNELVLSSDWVILAAHDAPLIRLLFLFMQYTYIPHNLTPHVIYTHFDLPFSGYETGTIGREQSEVKWG